MITPLSLNNIREYDFHLKLQTVSILKGSIDTAVKALATSVSKDFFHKR